MEPGVADVQLPELAPGEEGGGGVAGCPAETGGGGDALGEVERAAAGMVSFITKKAKRAQGEVVLAGEGIVVTAQLEINGRREGEAIGEIDGQEDGGDLWKPSSRRPITSRPRFSLAGASMTICRWPDPVQ